MPGSLNIFVLWFLVDSYQNQLPSLFIFLKKNAHFALFKKTSKGIRQDADLKNKINKLALVAIYKNQKSKICYEAGKSGNIKSKSLPAGMLPERPDCSFLSAQNSRV